MLWASARPGARARGGARLREGVLGARRGAGPGFTRQVFAAAIMMGSWPLERRSWPAGRAAARSALAGSERRVPAGSRVCAGLISGAQAKTGREPPRALQSVRTCRIEEAAGRKPWQAETGREGAFSASRRRLEGSAVGLACSHTRIPHSTRFLSPDASPGISPAEAAVPRHAAGFGAGHLWGAGSKGPPSCGLARTRAPRQDTRLIARHPRWHCPAEAAVPRHAAGFGAGHPSFAPPARRVRPRRSCSNTRPPGRKRFLSPGSSPGIPRPKLPSHDVQPGSARAIGAICSIIARRPP